MGILTKHISKLLLLSLPLILLSCSYSKIHSHQVAFREPRTLQERVLYNSTKGTVTTWSTATAAQNLESIGTNKRLISVGRELLKDIGGEEVTITTEDGALLSGIYFDPKIYKQKSVKAFKKWRQEFVRPKNAKACELFSVNFQSNSLSTLFSIPRTVQPLPTNKKRPLAVLCLPGLGLKYELDPTFILSYVARGYHVLAVNYREEHIHKGIPDWKTTSVDANDSALFLKTRLAAQNDDLIIVGKSFGSGPAIYAATQNPGSHVIIDRGFARLSDICDYNVPSGMRKFLSPFAKTLVEKFYRYPNEDWIPKVTGRVLLIEAYDDKLMEGQAEKLFKALSLFKTNEEIAQLKKTAWIKVHGGHHGRYIGGDQDTWYSDEKSQDKLTIFLKSVHPWN